MLLREATGVSFEQHQLAILNYCKRRIGAALAEDAASEVMEIAWRRQADIPSENALPYLYGIAYKVIANQRRSQRRQQRVAHRGLAEVTDNVEDVVLAAEDAEQVRDALMRLSSADQEVLRLSAWEHLSREEIAIALSITPNAVTKRFNRALDHLATELGTVRTKGSHFFRRKP